MKIKTSELTGAAIDWTVAQCRGFDGLDEDLWLMRDGIADMPLHAYTPSTDWAQGGPIIEREGITLSKTAHGFWEAYKRPSIPADFYHVADMPLIAAMRCFVASKLGDEMDVPEELLCTP